MNLFCLALIGLVLSGVVISVILIGRRTNFFNKDTTVFCEDTAGIQPVLLDYEKVL